MKTCFLFSCVLINLIVIRQISLFRIYISKLLLHLTLLFPLPAVPPSLDYSAPSSEPLHPLHQAILSSFYPLASWYLSLGFLFYKTLALTALHSFSVLVKYVTLYLRHHIYLRMDCFFRYCLNIFTQFRLVDYVVPSHWSHKVFGYTILFPNRLKKWGNLIRKIYLLRNPLFVRV